MSGSPVYVNGKLIGAVALRLSVFSPDAICGIHAHRADAGDQGLRHLDAGRRAARRKKAAAAVPASAQRRVGRHRCWLRAPREGLPRQDPILVPIETPLAFRDSPEVLRE